MESSGEPPPRSLRQVFEEVGGFSLPYDVGRCYAFEMLHPDLLTVAPASSPALVHLMTRDLEGFQELPCEDRFAVQGTVQPPQVLNFRSFGACRDAATLLPWDAEGYVIVDGAGRRIKVKSDAYKAMQRLVVGDSENADDAALGSLCRETGR